jgi:hypothetical protein
LGQDQQNKEKDEEDKDDPLHVVVFNSYHSHGDMADQAITDFTLLCKLWQCMGLPTHSNDTSSNQSQLWKGKEVLTTLLACQGFVWHDNVSLLWEDCGYNLTRETTPFVWAVLVFLDEAVWMVMWDTNEGSFPVQSALHQKWDKGSQQQ